MALLLLALACTAGLLLIPVGLPGTWLMIIAGLAYDWAVPGRTYGIGSLAVVFTLALGAELLELAFAKKWTEQAGGSSRAGWGALIGGLVGAIVGVPVFLVGSMLGAFVGAFVGAWVMELSVHGDHGKSLTVARGALVGRIAATAAKLGAGTGIMAWLLLVAWRG